MPRMRKVGEAEGIAFKFGGKIGNTRDSHRLIAEAASKSHEMQDKLVSALFHAYFEVNDDISDKQTLAKIAKDVGLFKDDEEALEFLKSDKRGSQVDREVLLYQYGQNISGVPHFFIDGEISDDGLIVDQVEVGGAQDAAVFKQIFDQLEKTKAADVEAAGDFCLPDGSNC
jgi:predicted DsbA family dithiol-disulfide isomerase